MEFNLCWPFVELRLVLKPRTCCCVVVLDDTVSSDWATFGSGLWLLLSAVVACSFVRSFVRVSYSYFSPNYVVVICVVVCVVVICCVVPFFCLGGQDARAAAVGRAVERG